MRIIATRAEFKTLPDWVREFAVAAWSTEDGFAQRAPLSHFKNMHEIAGRFADGLREALRDPSVCEHNVSLLLTDAPKFVEATVFVDPHIKIAHALMQAWNGRATLANCVICGTLMQPGKGRIAQTCSGACQVRLHREAEEYRREEAAMDEAIELEQEHLEQHGEPEPEGKE